MRRPLLMFGGAAACALALTACGAVADTATDTATEKVTGTATETVATGSATVPPSATSSATLTNPAATSHRSGPPAARVVPGKLVSGDGYVRPGTAAELQFSVGSGTWQCVIRASEAGCFGKVPSGPMGDLVPNRPDSVRVTADGVSSFEPGGAAAFGSRDAQKQPTAGKDLPAGRSIRNGQFICAAVPDDGIQCETVSGDDGFLMYPNRSWLW